MASYKEQECVKCGGECEVMIGKGVAGHVWKSMWFTDICEKPLFIESKQQLKDACKEHNVIAARLL